MNEINLIENKNVKLAIYIKLNQLKREQLSSLTYHHVESALIQKWKFDRVKTLNQAIDDIMSLSAKEIVTCLSAGVMYLGSTMEINDFVDLFGGDQ